MLRLLRILRAVKLIRHLSIIHHLYIITLALRGMGLILIWAIIILSLVLMVCALAMTSIMQVTYFNKDFSALSPKELATQHELYEYFGTFTRSFLSMFEITLANWPEVTRLLVEEVSEWFTVGCLLHKMTLGFAVIGVINGVILQETFRVAAADDVIMVRQHMSAAESMKVKMFSLLTALDVDGDGALNLDEFVKIAEHPEVKAWLAAMGIETHDVPTLFELIDESKDGTISAQELVDRVPRLRGTAQKMDVLALYKTMGNWWGCDPNSPKNPRPSQRRSQGDASPERALDLRS